MVIQLVLTKHMESQHTGIGGPVNVLTLRAVTNQLTAIWNVPYKEKNIKERGGVLLQRL